MLRDIGSRDDDLSLGDVIVLNKDNLQQITNVLIVVDDSADTVDKVDDGLGHPVTRRSLASKD